jgi:dsDNA-binding SOS-regulon protein
MIIEEIGLEKLPNCYIKMVEVLDKSQLSDTYKIHFSIKDLLDANGNYIWYKNKMVYPNLKILSIVSFDDELSQMLDNGEILFTKRELLKHAGNNAIIKQSSIMQQSPVISFDKEIEQGMLYSFSYGETFEVLKKHSNVKVYAALIVDTEELLNSKRIKLPPKELSSYRGPIFSEIIKEDGQMKDRSSIFLKPDNSIYVGPVHEHEGGFMEGSYHREEPHDSLTRLTVYNIKLKNYKKAQLTRPETSKINLNVPVFSPMYFSYSGDFKQSAMFSINIKSAILKNNEQARRLASLNSEVFDSLLAQVQIMNLTVLKQKVQTTTRTSKSGTARLSAKTTQQYKRLTSSKDESALNFVAIDNESLKLQEMIISTSVSERSFVLHEKYEKENKEKGLYKIAITLSDPFAKYFQNLNQTYKNTLREYKVYSNRATIKSIKESGDSLSKSFVNDEINKSVTSPETTSWINMSKDYPSITSHLKETTEQDINVLIQEAVFLSYPTHASTTSIATLLDKFSKLYDQFVKLYKVNQGSNKDSSNRGAPKNSLNPTIYIEKTMSQISTYEGRNKCLHYAEFADSVFPMLNMVELNRIAQKEIDNNFVNNPSFSGTKLSRKDKELLEKFSDYQDTLISYLNPIKIQDKKNILAVDNFASIDYEKLNDLVDNLEEPTRQDAVNKNKQRKTALSFKAAKSKDSYVIKKEIKTKDTDQNLGKSSIFKTAGEAFIEVNSRRLGKTTSNLLKRVKPKLKKKIFDLDRSKSLTDLSKKTKVVEKLPISLKSIFASDSSNVKNNFAVEGDDSIDNPKTSNAFRVSYLSPIKVEYLSGYKRDSDGNEYFTKPIWKLLTQKETASMTAPKLCRMRFHEISGFTDPLKELYIANELFIMLPNEEMLSKQPTSNSQPTIESVQSVITRVATITPEQCISNIIKQPDNIKLTKAPVQTSLANQAPTNPTTQQQLTAVSTRY